MKKNNFLAVTGCGLMAAFLISLTAACSRQSNTADTPSMQAGSGIEKIVETAEKTENEILETDEPEEASDEAERELETRAAEVSDNGSRTAESGSEIPEDGSQISGNDSGEENSARLSGDGTSDSRENQISGNEVSGNQISGNQISGNQISGNQISENRIPARQLLRPCGESVSGSSISGNAVSGNAVSGNAVSGNAVSGNTVSGSSVSSNEASGSDAGEKDVKDKTETAKDNKDNSEKDTAPKNSSQKVSGNDSGRKGSSANSASGNALSDRSASGNTVSGSSFSGSSVSDSSVSDSGIIAHMGKEAVRLENPFDKKHYTLAQRQEIRSSHKETLLANELDQETISGNNIDFSDIKITCLGDSITQAVNLDRLENYQELAYPHILQEALEARQVYNLGIGGSSIGRYWADAFVDRYHKIPEDSDIILVMGGTNDQFCASLVEFGTSAERKRRTFWGDLDELMRGLKKDYPEAEVIFMTPLPNSLQDYLKIQHPYLIPQDKYAEAIRELADEYGLEVIDLYNSNILDGHDKDNVLHFMPDGVHPNAEGYEILGEHVAADLIRILQSRQKKGTDSQ